MKNIVRLAKIFEGFIELDSSFVLVEDIKAIRKVDSTNKDCAGIEVITPYGSFYDNTDFDTFKVRIQDMMEALKEEKKSKPTEEPRKSKVVLIENEPVSGRAETRVPPPSLAPVIDKEVTIALSGNGSSGNLFDDPSFKVVNRDQIAILAPDRVQIASGTDDPSLPRGTIVGDVISGIVYESGRYTLAAKEYQGNSIIVRYQVRKR